MEVTETSEQVKIEAQRFEDVARYNIRRYMRLTGKIQKDLAHALGVSRPTITLMLKGETKLNLRQVFLIAKALGVTVEDLIDDTYYCQDEEFMKKLKPTTDAEKPGALVGAGAPRFLVSPSTPTLRPRAESRVRLKVPWLVSCHPESCPVRDPRPCPQSMTGLGFPAGLKPMRH